MGFPTMVAGNNLLMSLSQSFGYSVAGGQIYYGDNRLGSVIVPGQSSAVPEPATVLLFGFGLVGLAGARRKFKK